MHKGTLLGKGARTAEPYYKFVRLARVPNGTSLLRGNARSAMRKGTLTEQSSASKGRDATAASAVHQKKLGAL